MRFGALTPTDITVLVYVLSSYHGRPMRLLEIGVHTGTTSRGIKDYCAANKIELDYWGLDSGGQCDGKPPFDGSSMVIGDSAESANLVPEEFDVVFVDGCHCFNHVILDTVLYGEKVRRGGFILHHDTAPHVQHTMRDPHGPSTARFHNSVNDALAAVRFPWRGWTEVMRRHDTEINYGGMAAHQRTV